MKTGKQRRWKKSKNNPSNFLGRIWDAHVLLWATAHSNFINSFKRARGTSGKGDIIHVGIS